jgi:hypothetical protein
LPPEVQNRTSRLMDGDSILIDRPDPPAFQQQARPMASKRASGFTGMRREQIR